MTSNFPARRNQSKAITDILSPRGEPAGLGKLIRRASKVGLAQRLFTEVLPVNLRNEVILADYQNGTITVVSQSPAYATQIKLLQHELLESLRRHAEFAFAYRIVAKVRPVNSPRRKPRLLPTISARTAGLLEAEARLCDDEEIADALASLAKHAT